MAQEPPPYLLTQDDLLFPVYCTQCRKQVPVALSNVGHGLCPVCVQGNQQAIVVAQAAMHVAQQNQAQVLFATNTGMGLCAQCGSRNISQFDSTQASGSPLPLVASGAVCLLIGVLTICFWIGIPLAIIGVALLVAGACTSTSRKIGTSRTCNYCGYRWQV